MSTSNELSAALAALGLNQQQMEQQADLARRLLNMACLGIPRLSDELGLPPKLLALHALATAYMALSSAEPQLTRIGASLADNISEHLADEHERRVREAEEALYRDINAAFRAHTAANSAAPTA